VTIQSIDIVFELSIQHLYALMAPDIRPEALELTFPSQDSLHFWKDSKGRCMDSPSIWLWDGTCYRYPFSEFRLYFIPSRENRSVGRWCIYTGILNDFEGGFFCKDEDVPRSSNPADSIPYNSWFMRFGTEIELFGTVSCQAVPRHSICEAVETYVSARGSRLLIEKSSRGVLLGLVIWEDLTGLQGRILLPWLKENWHSLLRWGHGAYVLSRWHQAECIVSIINNSGEKNLLPKVTDFPNGEDPLGCNSPEATPFAREILKLPTGKAILNDFGCGSLLCLVKRDSGWISVFLNPDTVLGGPLQVLHNLVRTHFHNIGSGLSAAARLTCAIYDDLMEGSFVDKRFEDDPDALQTLRKICFMVAEAIHEKKEKSEVTIRLSESLATMATTRDIYREEECALIDPSWWKDLPDDIKEKLNLDAPERFLCPITHEVMRNPSLLSSSGRTYDRFAISWWMKKPNAVDPRTNLPIPEGAELFTNADLQLEICAWCKKQAKRLTGE